MAQHINGSAVALFRVFIAPMLGQRTTIPTTSRARATYRFAAQQRTYAKRAKAAPVPEVRTRRWNDEIEAKLVRIVDAETNRLSEPMRLRDVLRQINTATDRLVQVTQDEVPICKIENIKETIDKALRQREENRDKRKQRVIETSLKTLEINWAIDPNDLKHRLQRFKDFLQEGRKVELVLAAKKRGRRASEQECASLLNNIKQAVAEVPGARESKPMEGEVGGVALISFVGKIPAQADSEATQDNRIATGSVQ